MSKVMIDPGHGGTDSGAVGFGEAEKARNLVMARAIELELKKQGVEVVLTRNDDSSVPLAQRVELEKKEMPDCFISCHMDAAGEGASGMTVWVHSKADNVIWNWAQNVMEELKAVGFTTNRAAEVSRGYPGNADVDFYVNRETINPSMLIEFGFITNRDNLNEHIEHCAEYARAVARATCQFIGVEWKEPDDNPNAELETVPRAEYDRVLALVGKFQQGMDKYEQRAKKAEGKLQFIQDYLNQ